MGLHCLITDAAGEMTDEQKDILYACREESERLEKLMRDLTDLSRIESGEVAPRLALVGIEDVVQSASKVREKWRKFSGRSPWEPGGR